MAQYKTGSVSVTNGSQTVTGLGTLWSSEVSSGDIFTVVGENAWYEIGSVDSDTQITLSASYAGVSASGAAYAITRDFTTNYGWPYPQKGDIETASLIKRAFEDIDAKLVLTNTDGDVTVSGDFTLSGGTANGVAYLNGSKVLTTGSALTFDGTALTVGSSGLYLSGNTAGAAYMSTYAASAATELILGTSSNIPIRFIQNNSEAMRLTSTGLGIGTSSPITGSKVSISASGGSTAALAFENTQVSGKTWFFGPGVGTGGASDFGFYNNTDGQSVMLFTGGASGSTRFLTNGTERARIDSSGRLLVGASAPLNVNVRGLSVQASQYHAAEFKVGTNGYGVNFLNESSSQVGSIAINASTTTYNTSSDYRLKNTIAPMTGALAKVAALKPVTYKWNVDGSDGEGFIAHELAEVCPQAVTGEKDAVDADGNPVYQGIDTSFLVATLTAAIQEQQAIIEDLKSRLTAAGL